MKKIILMLGILISGCQGAFATQCVIPTIYATNGQVTAVNLNGDFGACQSIVNGLLDNTNANTAAGYRFFQTVSSLPAAGNQGAVYFLTSDNSLNLDNGSSFNKLISPSGVAAQGEVLYYGSSGITYTGVGTSGQPLISQGAGANATFGNISAAGSVSGASLNSLSSTPSGAGLFPKTNIGGLLGAETSGSACINAACGPATTDLYVSAWATSGSSAISCLTDSSSTPSTIMQQSGTAAQGGVCSMVVIKNQYWNVTNPSGTASVHYISIGS